MTIEDLEKAVSKLPPDQLARFRAWFEKFDAARFDGRLEIDIRAGRLDRIAEQAREAHRKGQTREI